MVNPREVAKGNGFAKTTEIFSYEKPNKACQFVASRIYNFHAVCMKKKSVFPDPASAMEDGLLAVGGNLTPELLLHAYERGIFPWFRDGNLIHWYAPPQRMVLFPSEIKVSQSMKQVLNSKKFSVTEDAAFASWEIVGN